MSWSQPGAGEGLRAVAFASPDGSAWGAALSDGARWSLLLGPEDGGASEVRVTQEPGGGWRIERDAGPAGSGSVQLLVAPEAPPVPGPTHAGESDGQTPPGGGDGQTPSGAADGQTPPGAAGPDGQTPPGASFVPGEGPELCRVTGTASGRTLDWRGIRATLPLPRSAREAPGSARFVAGWLADGSALGLVAARSRRDDHPDGDAVRATLFDPERWLAVSEPRLSTTYDASGAPARVNLELWIGEGEHEFPRRAAGEASGRPAASAAAAGSPSAPAAHGPTLRALPLRCHSRGEEGVGLYVLASF